MLNIDPHWPLIKKIFRRSFSSSFHFSIASVDENNNPHVTPIVSLILGEPGKAIYFEEFPSQLPCNLKTNRSITILAVNSGKWFWLKSLIKGKFSEPPALRLKGEAGALRDASETKIKLWHKRVKLLRHTRGHRIMWQRMAKVREVMISAIEPIHLGEMTDHFS